jgi:hypothetical protein
MMASFKHKMVRNHRSLRRFNRIHDIAIPGGDRPPDLCRRLLLDPDGEQNVIAEDIQQALDAELQPCPAETTIKVQGQAGARPLGHISITWSIVGREEVYKTDFYVMPDPDFDALLGRSSIIEYELYR